MKSTFIVNGKTQLILTPETDTERSLLAALIKQQNIMVAEIGEDAGYARLYGQNSVLITSQVKLHADEEEAV
jgi:hypothetical protein